MKKYLLSIVFHFSLSYTIAQPAISSFSPASGPLGTSVIISGAGFSNVPANNIVFFGAVRATVLNASSNSLTVQVPVRASYGLITVTVGQLMAYSMKPFSVTFAGISPINAASFPLKTDISSPTGPAFTLFKDLDDDGKPELIYGSSGVSFHKNNSTSGTIAFGSQTTLVSANGYPNYITVEDMDGDGKPDIIVPDYFQPLRIYKNTSSGGTISTSVPLTFPSTVGTFGVSTQDLDGDGRPDLVTTNNDIPGKFSVYRNTTLAGNISLSLTGDYSTASSYPRGVSFGHINSDNKPDMIIANQNGTSVSVFINNSTTGNISFAPFINLSVPSSSFPESISVADFDGDGKDDLAVANNSNAAIGIVSVFRNTSSGATVSFAPALNLTTGMNWNPYTVTAGDLDGDGIPEIAVANQFNNAVSIFKNNSIPGTLSFNTKFDLLRTGNPSRSSMAITDVDGDGRPDVISGTLSPVPVVSIFSNNIQVLPVNFISFTAIKNNNGVLLNWVVENETEKTDRYEVERSFTGTSFNKLAAIQKNAIGTRHSYYFTDTNINLPGVKNIYYRVKQFDKDGKAIYTEIRHLDIEDLKDCITVYPNPVNDIAILNFFLSAAENISFNVSDASGKIVRNLTTIKALAGANKKLIDMHDLETGIYYINIIVGNISKTLSVIKAIK
jgi:hypothetical protein